MKKGNLYIIPVLLGDDNINELLPQGTLDHLRHLRHFIVEKEKSARQFLKLAGIPFLQSELSIQEIDKHDDQLNYDVFLKPLLEGNDVGLLSEAGAPAVADPGALVVAASHRNGIKTIPLVGPSSILLALMACGLNGQSFCFHGYLPIDKAERIKKIKLIEKDAQVRKQTQLFIETPYRNNTLLKDLMESLSPDTKLCIASNITLADEMIATKKIHQWRTQMPDLNKKPTVFLLL